jgi:Schlafen, AlbA_2
LFNLPLDTITIQDIEQFLQSGARENTVFELKEQFPNKLERVISSMANTSGGMILIGVEETKTGGGVVPVKGIPLESGLRERVVQIGLNAIYPPVIPKVRVVDFKSDTSLAAPDKAVVVIRVHESDEGHAVDHRTAVYIRADNVSDRMRKATVEEVEWFLQKRQKSLAEKSRIIQQAQQHAEQFLARLRERHHRSTSEPKGKFIIWTVPTFPRSPIGTPKQLYEATQNQILQNLEIAPCSFPYGVPHALFEGIYWGHDESSNYYYTEIHQQGLIYSEFEFWWDRHQSNDPVFIPSAAAILLWAAAKFGRGLYQQFGYFGLFDLRIALDGIQDRRIDSSWRMMSRIMDRNIEAVAKFSTEALEEELLSKCKEMIRETYWAFGWDADDRRLESDFK